MHSSTQCCLKLVLFFEVLSAFKTNFQFHVKYRVKDDFFTWIFGFNFLKCCFHLSVLTSGNRKSILDFSGQQAKLIYCIKALVTRFSFWKLQKFMPQNLQFAYCTCYSKLFWVSLQQRSFGIKLFCYHSQKSFLSHTIFVKFNLIS